MKNYKNYKIVTLWIFCFHLNLRVALLLRSAEPGTDEEDGGTGTNTTHPVGYDESASGAARQGI